MSAGIVELHDDTFDDFLVQANRPVLVDFWASWCAPCKALVPALEQIATEFEGVASVASVDVERSAALTNRFAITSVPTMIVFAGGAAVDQLVGNAPAATIRRMLVRHADPAS